MKRILVLCVAIMLAIPAMSYAGSATSRWDITIGGAVIIDINWASQSLNQDFTTPERQNGTATSSRDQYNALAWGAGQTRLNFLVKGPDTWGAKTSAFVEFDFRSMTSNSVAANTRNSVEDYGLANLRHAFMKWDWPTFSLLIGKTWSVPGILPCFCLLDVNDIAPFNKGFLRPQITLAWQATKSFSITGGVMANYNEASWPGGTLANGITIDDSAQRSQLPAVFAELLYKTDACGKIGPWMLQFGLGGIYSQSKPIAPSDFGPVGNINNQNAANTVSNQNIAGVQYWNATGYESTNLDMWEITGKAYIPIIPEKAPGKLAGSLGLALTGFTGQNLRNWAGPPPFTLVNYEYNRSADPLRADFTAPVTSGGWGQLSFYFTDTVWAGFYYGQVRTNLSNARKQTVSPGAIEQMQTYIVNLVYDPNPAIRLGLQYTYETAHWANSATPPVHGVLEDSGHVSAVRFGAYYFF